MRQEEPRRGDLIGPLDLRKILPFEAAASSQRLGWVGLEALRYRDQPPIGAFQPPLTHHSLLLFHRTPKDFEAQYGGISRVIPPPSGSILMVPAGNSARWRWGSHSDSLHVFLEPRLVAWVAVEDFELDPAPGPARTLGNLGK
jgi:hypothetical protein